MWKVLKQILKKLNNIEKRIAGLESVIQDRQVTEISFGTYDSVGSTLPGCGGYDANREIITH